MENREWPSLYKNLEVRDITVNKIDAKGNILESATVNSKSDAALELFGAPF